MASQVSTGPTTDRVDFNQLRNAPAYRNFDSATIRKYASSPPKRSSPIKWIETATNNLVDQHVPKIPWCAILFERLEPCREIQLLVTNFRRIESIEEETYRLRP